MIDLLDKALEELKNAIKEINWEEVTESFTSNEYYSAENNRISEETEGGFINYSFGDYLLHHPNNSNKILESITKFLFRAENLVLRDEQVHKQLQILIPIDEKLRNELVELKNRMETRFEDKYKDLQFALLDMFEKKFINITNYEQLLLSIIDNSQRQNYEVFRWKGSQADLFRYIKLAIELNLIEDDKLEISDFIKKHVLCRNLTSNEYQPIMPSELKSTFYSKGRNELNVKFIKKLKNMIMAKYPD
jgi:hypothetical protein